MGMSRAFLISPRFTMNHIFAAGFVLERIER